MSNWPVELGPKLGPYVQAQWPEATEAQALATYSDADGWGLIWDGSLGPEPTPEQVAAWEPPRDPLAEGVALYRAANEAAREIIFVLMTQVAGVLIAFGFFTSQNVNDEGAEFVAFHRNPILDFKEAGRNRRSSQALYNAIANAPSRARFPWLAANDEYILNIFASELLTPE